eukprot:gene20404-22417_t
MQRSIFRSLLNCSQAVKCLAKPTSALPEALPKFATLTFLRACSSKWSNDVLKDAVNEHKIVVFMKGTPEEPMCGFSRAVVKILEMHGVEEFSSYNILEDEELRKRIKEFSAWPTVPQVYLNGEFVGGCDIMIQMHQSGELIEELQKVGHVSALAEENSES